MKVSVVFNDVSVEEADSLLRYVEEQELHLSHDKPKRQRRTKAEIEAAEKEATERRPTEVQISPEPQSTEPKPRRRRKREGELSAAPDAAPSKPDDAEITDADVARAASDAARVLTSKVVVGVLGEFGVANVGELSQEQRREFTGLLREKVDTEDMDEKIPF